MIARVQCQEVRATLGTWALIFQARVLAGTDFTWKSWKRHFSYTILCQINYELFWKEVRIFVEVKIDAWQNVEIQIEDL
jgi:hypothetical protein